MTQPSHPARSLSDLSQSFTQAFRQAHTERLHAVEHPTHYRIESGAEHAQVRHCDHDRER